MAYTPSEGSIAQRAIALLKSRGEGVAMRSPEIAEALGVKCESIVGCLSEAVRAGVLVTCRVSKSGTGGFMNEYRLSASGPVHQPSTAVISPRRQDKLARARESGQRKQARKPADEAASDERKASEPEHRVADPGERPLYAPLADIPEPDTAPSECAPPVTTEKAVVHEVDSGPGFDYSGAGQRRNDEAIDIAQILPSDDAPPTVTITFPPGVTLEDEVEFPPGALAQNITDDDDDAMRIVFSVDSDGIFRIDDEINVGAVALTREQAGRFCDFFEVMRAALDAYADRGVR